MRQGEAPLDFSKQFYAAKTSKSRPSTGGSAKNARGFRAPSIPEPRGTVKSGWRIPHCNDFFPVKHFCPSAVSDYYPIYQTNEFWRAIAFELLIGARREGEADRRFRPCVDFSLQIGIEK
jgi:hypothetical protein